MKKLLINGLSEPEYYSERIDWMYDDTPGQWKWAVIWLGVVFTLCLIAKVINYPPVLQKEIIQCQLK